MPLNTESHVQIGTSIIGMTYEHANNIDCMSNYKLREWKAAFGIRPIVCCEAWLMISSKALTKKLNVTHFYWALYFMRTYQTESELARSLKTNPKTLQEKVRDIVRLLSGAMNKVVSNSIQPINISQHICYFDTLLIFRLTGTGEKEGLQKMKSLLSRLMELTFSLRKFIMMIRQRIQGIGPLSIITLDLCTRLQYQFFRIKLCG
jgi:hypothetical protein